MGIFEELKSSQMFALPLLVIPNIFYTYTFWYDETTKLCLCNVFTS